MTAAKSQPLARGDAVDCCALQVVGDRYENMDKTSYHYSKAKAAA
jgi:hypothetical protein